MSDPNVFNLLCPFQRRWLAESAPLAIAEKSRRIGWTWTHALKVVLDRIDPKKPKANYYHSSADQTASVEFIEYCAQWAQMVNAVAKVENEREVIDDQEISSLVMRFANGAKIVAGTSSPKFFRSKGGEVGLDEYAFHRDGRELYKAAHATAMFWGHPLRIWSTHNGPSSYFNQMVTQARAGKLKAAVHRVTILDAVADGIVERIIMRKKRLAEVPAPDAKARQDWLDELRSTCPDGDTWNEEYLCIPSSDASSFLSYELIDSAVAQNLKLACDPDGLPADGDLYAGYDVGRKHDYSVLWVLQRVGDVYWTRMVRVLDRQSFASQEALLRSLMNRRNVRRLCIDQTGLGMQIAERMADQFRGGRVEGVTLSGPVKHSLGQALKGLFADKRIRIPDYVDWDSPEGEQPRQARSDWLREDLHKTRKIITEAGNVRLAADSDAGGHADGFWAGALALQAADESRGPVPAPLLNKPEGW